MNPFLNRTPALARLATIGLMSLLTITGSASASTLESDGQPLEVEASLLDATGIGLHGAQNVILRLAVEPDGEILFESRHTVDFEADLLPDPAMVDHGKMHLTTQPAPFYLEAYDVLWLTMEVDGLTGAPQRAIVENGTIRALDEESLSTRLDSALSEAQGLSTSSFDTDPLDYAKAANSDPALHAPYTGGLCSWNVTCSGTAGRFRWMRDGGASCWNNPAPSMPLVVLLRGNGYDPNEYDYMQDHLAANGMISVSIDEVATTNQITPNAQDHQDAADDVEDFLNSACFANVLGNFSDPAAVNLSRTGIVGHSRGGETARYLADNLRFNPTFTTRAVVSMAPTRHTSETLYGSDTPAYLVFGATHDGDVNPNGVFKAHDWGGYNEYSTPSAFDLDRGMKLFLNGSHAQFSDRVPFSSGQRNTAKGYTNAFLRAWLLNDWQFYHSYIRGDSVPGNYGGGISSQFSTRVARKVIDNFQDLNTSPNSLGGNVSNIFMDIFTVNNGDDLSSTPHAARGLRVRPNANNAYVRWDIPVGQRDFSTYLNLSVRVGQLTGAGPVTARLWIRNGGAFSWVDIDDFGGIPEPHYFCVDSCLAGGGDTMGYMRTIRVPVGEFNGIDDVDRVYLQFLTGAVGDQFLVDNLEFADAFVIAPF